MSKRAALRKARTRFGSGSKAALRELGGDLRGLVNLVRAHRVLASPWPQPIALLAEGRRDGTIDAKDFATLRSLATLGDVERYQTNYVRARAAQGVTLTEIQSQARLKTGNGRLWVRPLFARTRLLAGPAEVVWLLIFFHIFFRLSRPAVARKIGRWHAYGLGIALLHALASLMVWTFAIRLCMPSRTGVLRFGLLFVGFLLLAAAQCHYWWKDLAQRCPLCLDRLILPLTKGTADGILLDPAITESVCANGHGVLVESRWARRFRSEESPLAGLLRA